MSIELLWDLVMGSFLAAILQNIFFSLLRWAFVRILNAHTKK